MKDKEKIYKEMDLVYAAYNRCPCGAGLAYPRNCGVRHYWDCSAILTGKADVKVEHTAQLPFMFYEVKSEGQPSAYGATTRPNKVEVVDKRISLGGINIRFGVLQVVNQKGRFFSTLRLKYL